MSVILFNSKGNEVEIPLECATKLGVVVQSAQLIGQGGDAPQETTRLEVSCDQNVLESIKECTMTFRENSTKINSVENLSSEERQLLKKAEDGKWLVTLYDTAFELGFETLKDACAVYFSSKIDDIANSAPNPMEGAKKIRNFLNMRMDWTEEEMKHLDEEMQLAERNDSKGY